MIRAHHTPITPLSHPAPSGPWFARPRHLPRPHTHTHTQPHPHRSQTPPPPHPHPTQNPLRPTPTQRTRAWLVLGLLALTLVAWAKSYVGWVVVDGNSMAPTFLSGDLLLVRKQAYGDALPPRGDIVVARFRSEYVVKRVVALPGESVEVVAGAVLVNGNRLPEPALPPGNLDIAPGELFPDRLALLGDNRVETDHMLFYAVVPREAVVGKVVAAIRLTGDDRRAWTPPDSTAQP